MDNTNDCSAITRTKNDYTIEDSGKAVSLLELEARGLEFVRFIPDVSIFTSSSNVRKVLD